jgi:hypothetical protein
MLLIMIQQIKFVDMSALIYVDFDERNLKHPLIHVLPLYIYNIQIPELYNNLYKVYNGTLIIVIHSYR